jgi:hypothetical protein
MSLSLAISDFKSAEQIPSSNSFSEDLKKEDFYPQLFGKAVRRWNLFS